MKILKEITLLAITAFLLCSCGGHGPQQPEPPQEVVAEEIKPFNLKLYVEYSGSMYGYLDYQNHDFQNTIHDYLSHVNKIVSEENINLNFLNGKIINKGNSITKFVETLETSKKFKQAAGDPSSSDLAQFICKVLDENKSNDVSAIVSDFIFSPPHHKNPKSFLIAQQIIIRDSVRSFLNSNPNSGVMFLQFSSGFTGKYYDIENKWVKLDGEQRPFYMLIVGDKNALRQLRKNIKESGLKGAKYLNCFIAESNFKTPEYNVVSGTGDFKWNPHNPKHSILNAQKGRNGLLTFNVNTTYPSSILDDAYIANPDNYTLSDKQFSLTAEKHGENVVMHFSSPVVVKNTLNVKLMKKIPQWVEDFTDDDGLGEDAALSGKTFGLKYVVNGIAEAFDFDVSEPASYYTELKIDINQ